MPAASTAARLAVGMAFPVAALSAWLTAVAIPFTGQAEEGVARALAPLLLLPIAAAARRNSASRARQRVAQVPARKTILMVGRNSRTRRQLEQLAEDRSAPVSVIGVLDVGARGGAPDDCGDLFERHRVPNLGDLDNLPSVLRHSAVDEVIVTLPIKSCYDYIQATVKTCEEAGIPVSVCADLFDSSVARPASSRAGAARITYTCAPQNRLRLALKRSVDILGALTGLVLFSLPMLLVAVLIKLTSRGPVLFRQERVGLNHRTFQMLKFRTMVDNAEDMRKDLEHLNEVDGPVFKIRQDPRRTPIGGFLRKSSLDELPQLINVLRGEMSLVGPRPLPLPEVEKFEWWQRRRHSMKPGLTCFWQVRGRNNVGFEEWMRLDMAYIDNWSLLLDLKLLVKTVPVALVGRGAS